MAVAFLNREHTIAAPSYSRWLIPPAALCVHLGIGQAYAFSVFNLPMTKLIGIMQSGPEDWELTELGGFSAWRSSFPVHRPLSSAAGSKRAGRGARCSRRHSVGRAAF
jgi:hypothetical protein